MTPHDYISAVNTAENVSAQKHTDLDAAVAVVTACTAAVQVADRSVIDTNAAMDAGLPEGEAFPVAFNGKPVVFIAEAGKTRRYAVGNLDGDLTPPAPTPAPAA